jgi:hypothetical protein
MSTKPNQQQTLFRFVSIRPPQLVNDVGKKQRFVFSPDEGVFYDAVKNRPLGQSKREAMKIAGETFDAYKSAEAIEVKYNNYFTVATWIARNKQSFSPQVLLDMIQDLSPFDAATVVKFWDNLYFQIITQKDFYIKEDVMQFLVLNNLLAIIEKADTLEEKLKLLPVLANARVVLPTELFTEEEQDTTSSAKGGSGEYIFSTKSLSRSLEVMVAESVISRSKTAISELKVLQQDYFTEYNDLYQAANDTYEKELDTAFKNANLVEKERILCPSDCVEKYYEYENLIYPNFNFTPPVEVDEPKLAKYLSPESYYVVQSLSLLKEKTYESIIQKIEASIIENTSKIFSNLPGQPVTTTIGGMTFRQLTTSGSSIFLPDTEIPFTCSFWYSTASGYSVGSLFMALNVGFPNVDVVAANYSITRADGTTESSTSFTDSPNGFILNITFFPEGVAVPLQTFHFTGTITLSDGTVIQFDFNYQKSRNLPGTGKVISQTASSTGEPKAFVPKDFGIRRLGIADYKKVVAEVCCYREAEVSHIENILQGEFRSKTTTRERIEETTTTTENEVETENLTDTSTTERFEMQTEVANVLAQQKEFGAFATVTGPIGNMMLEAGTNFATNTAKEESNRQAVTESKEITQRAMERVVNRFRTEVVKKVTESYKEENSHIFDNRGGTGNVSGVYRYINAIYKNQIYNYGKRLMYEFMIPQPSKMHELGMKAIKNLPPDIAGPVLTEPRKPETFFVTKASELSDANYMAMASEYNADVTAPPQKNPIIGKALKGGGGQGSFTNEFNDIKIPEGYRVNAIKYQLSYFQAENSNTMIKLVIGTFSRVIARPLYNMGQMYPGTATDIEKFTMDTIPVALSGWDVGSYTLNLSITLERTDESYQNWQMKTYDTIIKAYKDRLQEYYDWLNRDKTQEENVFGTNPLFYRQIEQITLKRNCLAYLLKDNEMGQSYYTGDTFDTFAVTRNQQMDNYASLTKFMEQAFEWNLMSYNFYPYYWGKKQEWVQLYRTENDDPVFRNFMQAGMARVIVTVRPGFEDAVMHYMATGEIWGGGQVPVLGDPLYMSIAAELEEQEYVVEQTWETVVPTSLIGLQKDGVSIDTSGLPCGGGCEDGDNPLKPDTHKLPAPTPPVQQ